MLRLILPTLAIGVLLIGCMAAWAESIPPECVRVSDGTMYGHFDCPEKGK